MLAFRARVILPICAALVMAGCGSSAGTEVARTSAFPDPPADARRGTVERVSDGDTVRLVALGRVRLIGVDTPEVYGGVECYGREASAFAKRLLPPGTSVRYALGVGERDRYGRPLAYMWLPDGRMLNGVLVELGYATPLTIPPNVDYAEQFVRAARRARSASRGLWSPRTCNGRNPR
jgi:micrococcal nuclease